MQEVEAPSGSGSHDIGLGSVEVTSLVSNLNTVPNIKPGALVRVHGDVSRGTFTPLTRHSHGITAGTAYLRQVPRLFRAGRPNKVQMTVADASSVAICTGESRSIAFMN